MYCLIVQPGNEMLLKLNFFMSFNKISNLSDFSKNKFSKTLDETRNLKS